MIDAVLSQKERTFKLIGFKLLIKPTNIQEYFGDSIIKRPDNFIKPSELGWAVVGTVEAIGKKALEEIEKGVYNIKYKDKIICQRYVGTEVKIDDEPYRIITPEDVLATISQEEENESSKVSI